MNFKMSPSLLALVLVSLNKVASYTTTRSYDLQVPGSDPIRIIEAEPMWDRSYQQDEATTSTPRHWNGVEHRAMKPIRKSKPSYEQEEDLDEITETKDSSEELKEFLKKYAEQIRRPKDPVLDEEPARTTEPYREIDVVTRSPELTNRLASLYLDKDIQDSLVLGDSHKNWNLLNIERHKHPTSNKNGWVSLEVVPWSVSKVAKWQSNSKPNQDKFVNKYHTSVLQKPDEEESPWDTKYAFHTSPVRPKPSRPKRPNNAHQNKPFDYSGGHTVKKPVVKLPPTATYSNKIYLQPQHQQNQHHHQHHQHQYQQQDDSSYTDELPKPSWSQHTQNSYQQDDYEDEDQDPSDIITDGLPSNFPKAHAHHAVHNRRKGSSGSQDHPNTHPFHGNGEWVLLTTTKGFKPPGNNKQRSLDIDHDKTDIESINTRQSIKLTVLPPTKESKINMTTSHGGLLQVESTFQTVDEAHRQLLRKQGITKVPFYTNNKRLNSTATATVNRIKNELIKNKLMKAPGGGKRKGPNASTVLAAVGAGMIPATMAMLVPMALGKRRRRRDLRFDEFRFHDALIRPF